ncbi:MAG: translation elongation factor Ts, partial [Oscillospiraceae bacterium]
MHLSKDVQALRENRCGMMDCKKAHASDGVWKAVEFLREKGLAAAEKKAGRIAAEGIVYATVENGVGVVVEVNSETDFVAKNEKFVEFVADVAKTVIACNPADVEALGECKIPGTEQTVVEALREKILTIGENMKIRRFARMEGDLVTYIHGGGRIGVMVKFEASPEVAGKDEFVAMGKDVAMQIAAISPEFLSKESIPADRVEKEKEILKVQAMNEGKPANIAEKMVMGRLNKFYKETCLLEQPFVKDGDISVAKYIENTAKALGGSIKAVDFVRFE